MYIRATALLTAGLTIGLLFGIQATTVRAQDTVQVSAEKLAAIQSRCSTIKTNLNQLQTTDALLRVNRGQAYASISNDLMAKLNSRIALNRLDGSELIRVTTQYETNHTSFRIAYQEYSDELVRLMKIDCTEHPQQFYEVLVSTREKRKLVNDSVKRLNEDIRAYEAAFNQFRATYKGVGDE